MTSPRDTRLVEFLLARIAEDEDEALAARAHPLFDGTGVVAGRIEAVTLPADVARFVARHDPARVIAECDAKRRTVELHSDLTRVGLCILAVIRLLAVPYADHPDYHKEWRP